MKLIVGDELGLLKCVDVEKKLLDSKYGEIKKNNGVIGIDNLFINKKNILSVAHQENFYILDWNDKSTKYNQNINEKYTSQVVKKGIDTSTIFLSSENNNIDIFQFDSEMEITNYVKFETGIKNLFALENSSQPNEIFCLNKRTSLQIYDSVTNKICWKSKNLPNDELDLMVPIWDTDLAQNKSNHNLFYTSTAFGNIRTYDRKVKPKPVYDINILKNRINKVVETNCENYLVVGDTIGHMFLLDKRKNFQKVKRFHGQTGSVRDIVKCENTPYLFSCGLDRFLRIYDYKKNVEMPHIYLKNKLQCVYPYQINFQEEKEDLEYWESEDDKSDDEMNELSDDPDLEKEENNEDNEKEKKKIINKGNNSDQDSYESDYESDEEEDDSEDNEDNQEESDPLSHRKKTQNKLLNIKPHKPLVFDKKNKNQNYSKQKK